MSAKDYFIAIDRKDPDEIDILVNLSVEGLNSVEDGMTPLMYAVKCPIINVDIVKKLLEAGASPNIQMIDRPAMCKEEAEQYLKEKYGDENIDESSLSRLTEYSYNSALQILIENNELEVAELLLIYGAETQNLYKDDIYKLFSHRVKVDDKKLASISKDMFYKSRYLYFGNSNPENITDYYKEIMALGRYSALFARCFINDEENVFPWNTSDPVWCADRSGQTITLLPDNTMVLIAGEHEDWIDPDFRIYNDVFVITPEGEVTIFGYPESVFPPTDFHSATLVGDSIYILGSLGYETHYSHTMPIYRLDLTDYHIEKCETSGNDPGQVCQHYSRLIEDTKIRIWGGKMAQEYKDRPHNVIYELDLETMVWRVLEVDNS